MTPACLQVGHFGSGATISADQMIRGSTTFPPPLQLRSPTRSASLASLTCVKHPYFLPIIYLLRSLLPGMGEPGGSYGDFGCRVDS
jgi:hypothetical protein